MKKIIINSIATLSLGIIGISLININSLNLKTYAGEVLSKAKEVEKKPKKSYESEKRNKIKNVSINFKKDNGLKYLLSAEGVKLSDSLAFLKNFDMKSADKDTLDIVVNAMEEDGINLDDPEEVIEQNIKNKLEEDISNSMSNKSKSPTSSLSPTAIKEEKTETVEHCGLINAGNTCYLNAALQQIYANDELRENIKNTDFNCETQPVLVRLSLLFKAMENGGKIGDQKIDENDMQSIVKLLGFTIGYQHDSSECYTRIIEKCFVEGLSFNNFSFDTSYSIFGENKDKLSEKNNIVDYLTLNIDNMVTNDLEDYIKDGIIEESEIEGYKKNENSEPCKVIKETKMTSFPNKLIFSLNRTAQNYFGSYKTLKPFKINENININGHEYILKIVTIHFGSSLDAGHYVNYVRNNDGSWSKISDNTITNCKGYNDVEQDISNNATMAAYEKIN